MRHALALAALTALAVPTAAEGPEPPSAPYQPRAWINEIYFLPRGGSGDADGDGRVNKADQFVEIVNNRNSPLDVAGWTLRVDGRRPFVFPAGTSLPAGGAAVVFRGGHAPSGDFGGARVFMAPRGALRLPALGGALTLFNSSGAPVERRRWSIPRSERRTYKADSWSRHLEPDPPNGIVPWSDQGWVRTKKTPGFRADGTPFAPPPTPPEPVPEIAHVVVKTLVLDYDPIVEPQGGRLTHEVYGWTDPRTLAAGYAAKVAEASGGYVEHQIVGWEDVDEYPAMTDGFRYTDESFASAWASRTLHQPNATDYVALLQSQGVAARVKSGEVDEVWLFGFPYAGWFESCMAGPGAYAVNGTPLPQIDSGRKFIVMGFNYERGVPEMLHDLGHRSEAILTHVYGSWNLGSPPQHDWDRFTLYDKIAPGQAACGTVHFPPNGTRDYDYANATPVTSTCDDWLNFPNLTGATTQVSSAAWAGGPYELWWLSHLPRAAGVNAVSGKRDNWWKYVADFNTYAESR